MSNQNNSPYAKPRKIIEAGWKRLDRYMEEHSDETEFAEKVAEAKQAYAQVLRQTGADRLEAFGAEQPGRPIETPRGIADALYRFLNERQNSLTFVSKNADFQDVLKKFQAIGWNPRGKTKGLIEMVEGISQADLEEDPRAARDAGNLLKNALHSVFLYYSLWQWGYLTTETKHGNIRYRGNIKELGQRPEWNDSIKDLAAAAALLTKAVNEIRMKQVAWLIDEGIEVTKKSLLPQMEIINFELWKDSYPDQYALAAAISDVLPFMHTLHKRGKEATRQAEAAAEAELVALEEQVDLPVVAVAYAEAEAAAEEPEGKPTPRKRGKKATPVRRKQRQEQDKIHAGTEEFYAQQAAANNS